MEPNKYPVEQFKIKFVKLTLSGMRNEIHVDIFQITSESTSKLSLVNN